MLEICSFCRREIVEDYPPAITSTGDFICLECRTGQHLQEVPEAQGTSTAGPSMADVQGFRRALEQNRVQLEEIRSALEAHGAMLEEVRDGLETFTAVNRKRKKSAMKFQWKTGFYRLWLAGCILFWTLLLFAAVQRHWENLGNLIGYGIAVPFAVRAVMDVIGWVFVGFFGQRETDSFETSAPSQRADSHKTSSSFPTPNSKP